MNPSVACDCLAHRYDTLLLDLDGVVYRGNEAVPGAATAVRRARDEGLRVAFVTNNASRTPAAVVAHLASVGIASLEAEVVTSAEVAASLLNRLVPPRSRVLVTGGEGLRCATEQAGFTIVASADDGPEAVVQGYSSTLCYAALAETTLAVASGIPWVATNGDGSLPSPRGALPGNGALVALVTCATGREPTAWAGKPSRAIFDEAARRTGACRPLVVGDRLDTDIEGAHRAGYDSLLVLTGVCSEADLATTGRLYPTYVGSDLGALFDPRPRQQ